MAPSIRGAKRGGRPRTANVREVMNAIFYVLSTGCQWQALPKDPRQHNAHDPLACFVTALHTAVKKGGARAVRNREKIFAPRKIPSS